MQLRAQNFNNMQRMQQDIFVKSIDQQASIKPSAARLALAQRAADLVNVGDCNGARKLALEAQDQPLASRIVQVCTTPAK